MAKATQADPAYNELESYLSELANPPRTFERGQIVKGKVVAVLENEMVVDIGGRTEGIVSGRELKLDGKKIDKKIGDEVLVYVIKPENDKGQIELSIRRTGTARKWHDLTLSKENNTPISVKVIEANTGGVIVEIYGGLRGFIPSSHLDNRRLATSNAGGDKQEAIQQVQNKLAELIGTEIDVIVMEIDREKNRVILSEKYVNSEYDLQTLQTTLDNTQVGSVLEGSVTGIAPFGLFVTAQGLEGLVHLSEISWDKVTNPGDFYKVGDKVKVQVIGIEDGGKRIAYSIKRLLPDPWEAVIQKYQIGQVIQGEVTKVVDYGAFVRVEEGLNGLIHISELSSKLVKDPHEVVQEGQTIDVKIISMSRDDRHLGLSIRQLTEETPKTTKRKRASAEDPAEAAPEMARLEEILQGNQS
jgi:small subunit ribosomal protein S1